MAYKIRNANNNGSRRVSIFWISTGTKLITSELTSSWPYWDICSLKCSPISNLQATPRQPSTGYKARWIDYSRKAWVPRASVYRSLTFSLPSSAKLTKMVSLWSKSAPCSGLSWRLWPSLIRRLSKRELWKASLSHYLRAMWQSQPQMKAVKRRTWH